MKDPLDPATNMSRSSSPAKETGNNKHAGMREKEGGGLDAAASRHFCISVSSRIHGAIRFPSGIKMANNPPCVPRVRGRRGQIYAPTVSVSLLDIRARLAEIYIVHPRAFRRAAFFADTTSRRTARRRAGYSTCADD